MSGVVHAAVIYLLIALLVILLLCFRNNRHR